MGSDFRFALRSLRRSPLVTVVAVLCLALGIGANTTAYSVADAFVIHPMPGVRDVDRMVVLSERPPDGDDWSTGISPANFADWSRQATGGAIEAMAAYHWWDVNITGAGGDPERAIAGVVTPNLFGTSGVRPFIGRGFLKEEALPGRPSVIVLGEGIWRRRFGGDSGVVGRAITLNGAPYSIVGVVRERGLAFPKGAQLYAPLVLDSAALANRKSRTLDAFGLLRPGATVEQARAEVTAVAQRLRAQYPESNRDWGVLVDGLVHYDGRYARPYVAVVLGAVAFVLLIACANVTNLLLARGAARQREMAVRTALGAGRARLVRALLAESLTLALLGGGVGTLLALWGTRLVREAIPVEDVKFIPSWENITVHGRALAFTVALAALTSLVFGLAPALAASRADPQASLRRGGRGSTAGGTGRGRRALVVLEVALSLVLMVCTALMVRSFARMTATDPGFRMDHLLSAQVLLPKSQYPDSLATEAFTRRLLDRLRALPGVRSAAATNVLPMSDSDRTQWIAIEGRPAARTEAERPWAGLRTVTPDYLATLGIPLRHGRGLMESDDARGRAVALVNEAMARRYWPGEDPARMVGRRFTIAGESATREVVGVVGDVRHRSIRDPAEPEMYVPAAQTTVRSPRAILRTAADVDPAQLAPAFRREVAAIDPALAPGDVMTMESMSDNILSPYKITAAMLGVLAVVALVLAGAGVFGVLSYAVAQRTQEIGIRMALGARATDVLRLVVRQGMAPALIGVAIGLAGAVAAARALGGMLFGVTAGDPATFGAVTAVTIASALVASWLPARRATRVDPMVALREE
ncbi:MAG TPA: ABC transporter permease [Gemmatimonadaceae bacterium]|nr:ABC transporter permease [Gemmatimonadaceae bacterium]